MAGFLFSQKTERANDGYSTFHPTYYVARASIRRLADARGEQLSLSVWAPFSSAYWPGLAAKEHALRDLAVGLAHRDLDGAAFWKRVRPYAK
jgi:hypothetical protein